ncbi:MAG TPA: GPP34 family phosphoprotein [Ktedonosporobacter sp.]|jgi:hypothetical protein|nr:GPP34 family phosphoprotein [Ktedonosporobacter sp.]
MTDFFEQRAATNFGQERSLDTSAPALSFLEASTLLLYRTGVDAYGEDVPLASGVALKMSFYTYLGAALIELALRGYVCTDESEEAKPSPSRPPLYLILALLFVAFLSLSAISIGSTPTEFPSSQLALPIGLAGLLCVWLCGMILAYRYQRAAERQGLLMVMGEPPTGDEVLDELLWQMQPVESAMKVRDWLSFLLVQRAGKQLAGNMYDQVECRLREQGCIQLMGKERFLFGKVETLVINRQNGQWRNLSKRLRQALLSEGPSDPYTTALLILLTLIPGTFQTPIQVRLPGQPAGGKTLSGIYQILSEPAEIELARQNLRTLLDREPEVMDALGPDLYNTLLRLRLEIHEGPKRRHR